MQTPTPGVMKFIIYNFGRPFLGYHYYIYVFSLSDLCSGVQKILKRNNVFSLYALYVPVCALAQESLSQGS